MNLTPGATLQNQKYVIQQQLHQSDFGVIYQARHTYLEQAVVLQTLNTGLRQRQDFDQLRQQFIHKVRAIVQSSGQTPEAMPVRILDCFEEGGLPFVVFEWTAGQPPHQFIDWFPLMPHTVNPITAVPGTGPTAGPSETTLPVDTLVQTAAATSPAAPAATTDTLASETLASETLEVVLKPAPVGLSQNIHAGKTGQFKAELNAEQSVRLRSKAGLPLALLIFSLLGGLLGAGLGLSMRLTPATTAANQEEQNSSPNLPASFLSREQSFPAEQDWPISETPQFFTSDPLPVEEPVYRGNSVDAIVPDYPVVPESSYQQPVIPSERPAAKSVTPTPSDLPSPTLPDLVSPVPAPENLGAGSAPAAPIPAPALTTPSEPAPPAISDAPAPPASAPSEPLPPPAPVLPSAPAPAPAPVNP